MQQLKFLSLSLSPLLSLTLPIPLWESVRIIDALPVCLRARATQHREYSDIGPKGNKLVDVAPLLSRPPFFYRLAAAAAAAAAVCIFSLSIVFFLFLHFAYLFVFPLALFHAPRTIKDALFLCGYSSTWKFIEMELLITSFIFVVILNVN